MIRQDEVFVQITKKAEEAPLSGKASSWDPDGAEQ
jgi:hypothetical protein